MSIVFINYSDETFTPTQSGALATIIYESCRAARRQGQEPQVISRSSSAAAFDWHRTHFIDYPRLPTSRAGIFLARADRRIFGWRHLRQRAYAGRVLAALAKTGAYQEPLILMNDPEMACTIRERFPQAPIIHWFENQHSAKEKFRRRFGKAVDIVVAVSRFTARWVEEHYELPPNSVRIVHNGVDPEAFHPAPWNLAEKPVINFVGRTGIEKAPDTVLKACLLLAKSNPNFRLQLLGSNHWGRLEMDDYQRQLSALADQLTAAGIEVRRPGHIARPQLPSELRKAQIHITPSRWEEPFGMVTLEGMATGLATVASRTGGTPDVVGDAGILFERDNIEELAGHLQRLLADDGFRCAQGEKARRRAEEMTWAHTWASLSDLAAEAQKMRSLGQGPVPGHLQAGSAR